MRVVALMSSAVCAGAVTAVTAAGFGAPGSADAAASGVPSLAAASRAGSADERRPAAAKVARGASALPRPALPRLKPMADRPAVPKARPLDGPTRADDRPVGITAGEDVTGGTDSLFSDYRRQLAVARDEAGYETHVLLKGRR